mgnify:CR=1 FL=1
MPLNPVELLGQLPGALSQGLIWGIMAIGVYITFKILNIADLTVDGSLATGGAVCAMMILGGHNVGFSMLCAFLAGLVTGFATGVFHIHFGISAILSGILTQLGLWSVNLAIMGRANISINVNNYRLLVSLRYLQEALKGNRPFYWSPIVVVSVFAVAIIALLYWFFGTELGSSVRATGANIDMARAQGINTDWKKMLGLMLSNGLVALSGALLAQYQGFSDISMGRGAIVIGLAAVIIGEVIFGKIFKNFALRLLGVVFGAIIYFAVIQTVLWMRLEPNYLKLLSAVVVGVFLAFPYWKGKLASFASVRKGGARRA